MVYGLNIVSVHGFAVNVETLDGNMSAIRSVDQEPDGGVSFKGFTSGRRCHTDQFPTRMRWLGPLEPPIPDFDRSNLLNVSGRAKDFIESFEPGVHQFVPVDYLDKRGDLIEKRYFWVVCNRIDGVDREHTTFVLLWNKLWRPASDIARSYPDDLPLGVNPSQPAKFVFNLSQIGNAHVWRDKHMDLGNVWLSHELGDALKVSGLTGVKLSDSGLESI